MKSGCNLKCLPGEKLLSMAALFAIEFSAGLDANEVLAWGDFFSIVASGLIAIADRRLYIEDPTSDCGKLSQKQDASKRDVAIPNEPTTSI